MPNIYKGWLLVEYKPPDSARLDTTLFELMTSNETFLIDGIRILPKNSPEWKQVLDETRQKRENLATGMPKEYKPNVEQKIEELTKQEVIYDKTDFSAMHFLGIRLLYADKRFTSQISVKRKAIDFFRPIFPADSQRKARTTKLYQYDGTLQDALVEFMQNEYTFTLWDKYWAGYHIMDEEIGPNLKGVTPIIQKATIDQVLEFAGQRKE